MKRAMETVAWNCDKQRLVTMDVEFNEENTTWFEGCMKESDIHKITDVDGGILICKAGYDYPVWIGGQSRADIQCSRKKARKLEKLALNP
jgi:hypothetical protein